jgi:hypothetical protein
VWKFYQAESAWKWQSKAEFGNRNQSPPGKDGDGATLWVFEPSVAERIFDDWLAEFQIPVTRNWWLDREGGVIKRGPRIVAIRSLSGQYVRGKVFIDTTYEGDLLASAGCDYHIGREANATYNENWNGIQTGVLHHSHHFTSDIDPYREPGNPASGLLPLISSQPPGEYGDGDHRIQAYCFRLCMTKVSDNRIPFPKPTGYDADEYLLLLRVLDSGWRQLFNKYDPIPNRKTDTNNHGPVSSDYIGMNYDYPEASYERRQEIVRDHERYQKGLLYFMANDPRVPEDVRAQVSQWGLAADEFVDHGGWPHQIYVREARRLIGRYVMTEHDCLDTKVTPESIGMGSYTLDSHNVQRYVKPDGFVQNEGDIGVKAPRPYEISLGSIQPKREQCENLLVPVCVSSSHIAFGSIRMEPVFMILGQSAATVASMAIDNQSAVQDVEYQGLRQRLLSDGQVLELADVYQNDSKTLPGVVVDDSKAKFEGAWRSSSANKPYVDYGYQHDDNASESKTIKKAVFEAKLEPGNYRVGLAWPPNNNRSSQVQVTVQHEDGQHRLAVNQRVRNTDQIFQEIGVFQFDGLARVTLSNEGSNGHVIADAVQFLPLKDPQ